MYMMGSCKPYSAAAAEGGQNTAPAAAGARFGAVAQNGGAGGLGGGWLGLESCPISGRRYSASGGRGPAGCGAAAKLVA